MAIPVRFVALIIALFGGLAAHAQKPITIQARAIDGLRAPARVAEMVAQADAVVIATATGRVRLAAMKREEDGLRSVHSFDVAEALKFNAGVPAAGDVLELELPGGEREYATHVLRETVDGEEPVRAGRRYLIFVNWIQGRDEIRRVPAWPMGGIYDISGPQVRSLSVTSRAHDGKDVESFIGEVRAAGLGR